MYDGFPIKSLVRNFISHLATLQPYPLLLLPAVSTSLAKQQLFRHFVPFRSTTTITYSKKNGELTAAFVSGGGFSRLGFCLGSSRS